jgi:predicted permease
VATPLALMAIGFSLGHTNVREILFNKRLYAFSVLKLIVIPAVSILILKAIPLPGNLFGVTAALLAMPVGNMPLILSVEYDVDGKVCSEGIILSTILSMATLPLVMGLV